VALIGRAAIARSTRRADTAQADVTSRARIAVAADRVVRRIDVGAEEAGRGAAEIDGARIVVVAVRRTGASPARTLTAGPLTARALAAGPLTARALAARPSTARTLTARTLTAGPLTARALAAGASTARALAAGASTARALAAGPLTARALAARPSTAGARATAGAADDRTGLRVARGDVEVNTEDPCHEAVAIEWHLHDVRLRSRGEGGGLPLVDRWWPEAIEESDGNGD
jgi:hypothetical protein